MYGTDNGNPAVIDRVDGRDQTVDIIPEILSIAASKTLYVPDVVSCAEHVTFTAEHGHAVHVAVADGQERVPYLRIYLVVTKIEFAVVNADNRFRAVALEGYLRHNTGNNG